jgi:hypothetical protein
MKRRDYITVERKTLEKLISACEGSIFSWFFDPSVQLRRALRGDRQGGTANAQSGDYITVKRETLEELISASSMVRQGVSWFFDPSVQLKRALKRMRAEIARVDAGET